MWEFFSSYQPVVQSLKTVNEPVQIIEKSTVSLCLVCSDSDIQKVVLCDVMHVFSLSANLISDYCMQFDNVIFDMTDCTLHYNDDIIEHALKVNRLFQLYLNDLSQFYTFAASRDFKISFKMWHCCLGHLDHANIEQLARMTDSMNLTDLSHLHCENICEACMKVKQTHHLYNTLIKSVTWILNLIHLNIVSLITSIVYDSLKYFVTLINNYIRFTWMYLMKKKKQTAKHVKSFIVIIKTHLLNLSVSHFCTDYEHECLDLKDWFSSENII